ncbi:hypothetical protein ACMT1E_11945 [Sphingomonas flavalba]|uniref:hypothetical protein n=1 Tax=Sphingomonas flavalba TaxID=2559804 RepID=UPI0039E1B5BD
MTDKHVMRGFRLAGAAAMLAAAGGVQAQTGLPKGTPEIYDQLIACRALTDQAQRYTCYDTQVAALEAAVTSKQVAIVDREQIREARRGLFGLTLPSIRLFGGGDKDDSDAPKEIEATISTAYRGGYGEWFIVLEDGAKWHQIDNKTIMSPKPGQTIRIRSGVLGSYMANVNKQPAIKVRREN